VSSGVALHTSHWCYLDSLLVNAWAAACPSP